MGKRRIRNLHALGHSDIAGFDLRVDRITEAVSKYQISPFEDFRVALDSFQPDGVIISTDPRHHLEYAHAAVERNIACFIEASVVDADGILELNRKIEGTRAIVAPSCTMRFFPGPQKVKELLDSGVVGKVLNFNYQTGQWLPDWHPWEDIRDFYVSNPDTGGCREIVPFELTWLNDIFGTPEPLACVRAKVSDMPAEIDDVYHSVLGYPGGAIGAVTVEVLSRPHACRELRVIGSQGELIFSADSNSIRYATVEHPEWSEISLKAGTVEKNYINPEEPYIEELGAFVEAARAGDPALFPNSLHEDGRILQILNRLEQLAGPSR